MKKFLGVLVVSLGILSGCSGSGDDNTASSSTAEESSTSVAQSTSKATEVTVSVDSPEVTTDATGKAIIKGKATPGANVSVGLGIVGDSVEAGADGAFELTHEVSNAKEETLDINASLDGKSAKTTVKVVPSQEAIDAEASKDDITKLSTDPTIEQQTTLSNLAQQQFDSMFPYKGSKMKSIMGVIQPWTAVDDHWFYKVEATVVNAFGAEQDTVVEVTIVPTGAQSGQVSITNY